MKNICIFSDGTGQAGGADPVKWTNVYRLFTATRDIAPDRQLCFYDPGLGGNPDKGRQQPLSRWAVDILSKATGYGITRNIVDCYTAVLLSYEPKDNIFLFGFSRGAYTVRSLGGVLGLCGVPPGLPKVKHWTDFGKKLESEVRTIAKEAVTKVYQERDELRREDAAAQFREKHGSTATPPYFIGVWDTVRALGIKGISDLLPGRHRFNNAFLNDKVAHGRQALAIDENRETFKPEIWDERGARPGQIKQLWFAGVHTDIGGGYGLRMGLSDITLQWMITEATSVTPPLAIDPALAASLRPDCCGKQHDELRAGRIPWKRGTREDYISSSRFRAAADAYDTVEPRFRAKSVPILDDELPYRPVALRFHPTFRQHY